VAVGYEVHFETCIHSGVISKNPPIALTKKTHSEVGGVQDNKCFIKETRSASGSRSIAVVDLWRR